MDDLRQHIRALRAEGKTLSAVADQLNGAGIPTPGGCRWGTATVSKWAGALRPHSVPPLTRLAERLGAADLDGAACAGRAPLFDADLDREPVRARSARHARAVAICRTCPVRARCADAVAELPRLHRSGVWAGRPL